MTPLKICAIVAMDENRVIGVDGKLPWKLSEDMKRFAQLTTGHTVLMGRKTYESLPQKFRPLPNRKNVVLTRNPAAFSAPEGVEVWSSPGQFFDACRAGQVKLPSDRVWVIGGAEIYAATKDLWNELYLTRVFSKHNGDAYFAPFEDEFKRIEIDERQGYSFEHYVRK
jgi:dihydrofolate reductase